MDSKFATWIAAEKDRVRRLDKIKDNAANNRALAAEIKMRLGCVDCGYKGHPAALQFDHRDQETKRGAIGQLVKKTTRVMLSEIAKCDVRCANCHSIRTTETKQHLGLKAARAATKRPPGLF